MIVTASMDRPVSRGRSLMHLLCNIEFQLEDSKMKKNIIELEKHRRQRLIEDLRNYFNSELDEPIGELKASLILDTMIDMLGPDFYNRGVEDAKTYISQRIIEESDYLLK